MDSNNAVLIKRLLLVAMLLAFLVIALGAFTRLVHAGLGCPDWPTCYGHLWVPDSHEEIAIANQRFEETPVETDKTWPEQLHRILASSLGLLIIIINLLFYVSKAGKSLTLGKKHALLILFAVIIQGLFGMWTVTLKLWPQVVTLHLLGGFTTLTLLWLLYLRLAAKPWQLDSQSLQKISRLKTLATAAVIMLILQISLGGWTTSNYAAVACPDLPLCQQQWFPAMDFKQGFNILQEVGPNYLGGQLDNASRVAIHISHRLGALAVTLLLMGLLFFIFKHGREKNLLCHAYSLTAILIAQISLGFANILLHFPVSIAVMHNVTAAILLLSLVSFRYRMATMVLINNNNSSTYE